MPKRNIEPTMTWDEAPDTVDCKTVAKILGCGLNAAADYFHEKDFPLLDRIGLKADKEAARMYFQGYRIKQNPKLYIEQMILEELKKLNKKFEGEK